jgi:hypothetical protein
LQLLIISVDRISGEVDEQTVDAHVRGTWATPAASGFAVMTRGPESGTLTQVSLDGSVAWQVDVGPFENNRTFLFGEPDGVRLLFDCVTPQVGLCGQSFSEGVAGDVDWMSGDNLMPVRDPDGIYFALRVDDEFPGGEPRSFTVLRLDEETDPSFVSIIAGAVPDDLESVYVFLDLAVSRELVSVLVRSNEGAVMKRWRRAGGEPLPDARLPGFLPTFDYEWILRPLTSRIALFRRSILDREDPMLLWLDSAGADCQGFFDVYELHGQFSWYFVLHHFYASARPEELILGWGFGEVFLGTLSLPAAPGE